MRLVVVEVMGEEVEVVMPEDAVDKETSAAGTSVY
jgi:hypothetical protein